MIYEVSDYIWSLYKLKQEVLGKTSTGITICIRLAIVYGSQLTYKEHVYDH
jgi:hypothetical protein